MVFPETSADPNVLPPPIFPTPQRMRATNNIAAIVADTLGDDGYLPLTVRHRAAQAAIAVVEDWKRDA